MSAINTVLESSDVLWDDKITNYLCSVFFVAGVPIGFFSASLNEIARTMEDCSYSQSFANKLNWIDLSAENSMVNVVYDLAFFSHYFL